LSHSLDLDLLDIDGAVRESAEAAGFDRSDFLKKGVLAGGGLIAGSALLSQFNVAEAAISKTKLSKKNDVKILNFALTLEFLEAAFYREADTNKVYGPDLALQRFTQVVRRHEAQHVAFLKGALGSKAIRSPRFDFGNAVTDKAAFAATAQVLEDTGVAAYLGQAANIFQGPTLTAAGTILTVEARHAAWIRFINVPADLTTDTSDLPSPRTFERPATERATLRKARPFIKR